jgi:type IX secretion system PorP/SprF family membrane protein
MKKLILVFCFAQVIVLKGFSQDPHFSQYYASPVTVNPAATGLFDGDARISGLYRQQWPEYGDPFVSGTFAFELKPKKYLNDAVPDRLSYGGMLMFDRTPDGVLKSEYAYALLAYHKALDEEGVKRLGVGVMVGYNQKSIDATQLTFASQFESGGFGSGVPTGENISYNRISSLDVHTGLMYSYNDGVTSYYLGGAGYHLANPKNYFTGNNQLEKFIPKRWDINTGFNIHADNLNYAGSAVMMYQAKAMNIVVGGAVGIPFGETGIFYIGSWYRVKEAIIPTINLQWQNINLGLSQDVLLNNKNQTLAKPKSFELSLSYRPKKYRDYKTGCFAF